MRYKNRCYRRAAGSLLLSASMLLTGVPAVCTQAAEPAAVWKDGTWQGTAEGYESWITVGVTVRNGRIARVYEISQGETDEFWDLASDEFDRIVKAQSTDLDTISGATWSSRGILKAAAGALEEAEREAGKDAQAAEEKAKAEAEEKARAEAEQKAREAEQEALARAEQDRLAQEARAAKEAEREAALAEAREALSRAQEQQEAAQKRLEEAQARQKQEQESSAKESVGAAKALETPPAVTGVTVKTAKKALTVKWKKQSNVSGYEIQVATNRKFTKNLKTIKVNKASVGSKKIAKLKAKKKYFIRVRALKNTDNQTLSGKWSKILTKKTK